MEKKNQLIKRLLEIKAVSINTKNPYTWTSGLISPIYIDNRLTLSYPDIRNLIGDLLANIVKTKYPKVKAIAGVATAGIGHGLLVAEKLNLPFVYVRASEKGHGKKNQIEGDISVIHGDVVVVEDLISTAKSSVLAADVVQDSGLKVAGIIAIFSYLLKDKVAANNISNYEITTITNINEVLDFAREFDYIKNSDIKDVKTFISEKLSK